MQISKAELKQSIFTPQQYSGSGLPEIAVVGRSNAGKSSLINALCNQRIARVSQQPGKTRSINAYCINGSFMLMDLPGYGYARRSDKEQEQWRQLVEGYFKRTEALVHLLLLCDIRHDPSDGDRQMVQFLRHYEIPYTLIATKADKIAKSKRNTYLKSMLNQLGFSAALWFSTMDLGSKETLLTHLAEILAAEP